MAYRKYRTREEQVEARKVQNQKAAKRYREKRMAEREGYVTVQTKSHPSIDNDDERLEGISREVECPDQRVEKASGEVECPESEWELPKHPSSRLMVEMKLARINKDVQDIANILQNTTDPSLRQYVMEQRPCIQPTVDTLQSLQDGGSESTTASVERDITDSKVSSTLPPPAHPSPISDCQPRSSSTLEGLDSSPEDILRSLEAEVQQQRVHNSVAWNYTRKRSNLFISAL